MKRNHRFSRAGLILGGALLVTGSAARADWLVLTDGSRVETRGPWKEKGKLVVFTRADGTLASLRGTEVDLAASRTATAESLAAAAKPAEAPPAEPPKKLAIITDKDLPRRLAPAAAAAPEKTASAGGPVTVLGWKKEALPSGDGVVIVGTLQNLTDATATNITLDVSLANEKGSLLATAPGIFPTRILAPKGSVEFRATFQGVVDFAGVKFDARGWAPETAAPPPPAPEAAAPQPDAPPPAEGETPPPPVG
jgi:hypothetical protein